MSPGMPATRCMQEPPSMAYLHIQEIEGAMCSTVTACRGALWVR